MSDSLIKVVVTGASGFVGLGLLDEFNARGVEMRGVSRYPHELSGGIKNLVVGDINASTDWRDALMGYSVVVHLAARVHVMQEASADHLLSFGASMFREP